MADAGLDAYVISGSDPHLSEYPPERWWTRRWISGFTGSAGTVVVTADNAGLWTDFRYYIQAAKELEGSGLSLYRMGEPGTPEYRAWLKEQLAGLRPDAGQSEPPAPARPAVGFDGTTFSVADARKLEHELGSAGIRVDGTRDLMGEIWRERPAVPSEPLYRVTTEYAGVDIDQKLAQVRGEMEKQGVDTLLVSALDDVAWLLNLRGSDVPYNPVFLSYALVHCDSAVLHVGIDQVPNDVACELAQAGVRLQPYTEIASSIATLPDGTTLAVSPESVNATLFTSVPGGCDVREVPSVIGRLKAEKNATEIACLREALRTEGRILVRFFMWLEREVPKGSVTEVSAADYLRSLRANEETYIGEGFGAISAFGANAALCHYNPDNGPEVPLSAPGLYLLDSGGQYRNGTTDTTRTVALGTPAAPPDSLMKRDFTLVLKAHIALATAVFPTGTTGHQLDAITRAPMWRYKADFGHGIGHGIGFILNVHEGPQSISKRPANTTAMKPGMVTSNEPGLYREGGYGIRTENLILTVEVGENGFGEFLGFETLTHFPIDLELVDLEILEPSEQEWLNDYHEKTYAMLAEGLSTTERAWLREKTRKI